MRTSLCCLNFSQIWLVLLLIRCLNFLITFVTHFENIRISNFYLKLGIYRRVIWQIRKRQGFYHCISIQTVWISRVIARKTFTRIMVSKGMVSKSKYWNSEKNKGTPLSICLCFKGIFQSQYSLFWNFKGFLLKEINHSGEKLCLLW